MPHRKAGHRARLLQHTVAKGRSRAFLWRFSREKLCRPAAAQFFAVSCVRADDAPPTRDGHHRPPPRHLRDVVRRGDQRAGLPPPLGPGESLQHVGTFGATVGGTVDDFDSATYATNLAGVLGVPEAAVRTPLDAPKPAELRQAKVRLHRRHTRERRAAGPPPPPPPAPRRRREAAHQEPRARRARRGAAVAVYRVGTGVSEGERRGAKVVGGASAPHRQFRRTVIGSNSRWSEITSSGAATISIC